MRLDVTILLTGVNNSGVKLLNLYRVLKVKWFVKSVSSLLFFGTEYFHFFRTLRKRMFAIVLRPCFMN